MEVNVRFRYISIKGDWERSKAEAAFLNRGDCPIGETSDVDGGRSLFTVVI